MFKLYTEKLVIRGEEHRKILGWEGCMKKEETPTGYTNTCKSEEHYFYEVKDGLVLDDHHAIRPHKIRKGDILREKLFQAMLKQMKEAGERLHQLRKREKQLQEEWQGKETIVI